MIRSIPPSGVAAPPFRCAKGGTSSGPAEPVPRMFPDGLLRGRRLRLSVGAAGVMSVAPHGAS